MTDDLSAQYRRWLEGLWSGDLDAAADLVAEDVVHHQRGTTRRGRTTLVETIRQTLELFDDVSVTLDVGPVVDGALVAGRWTFRGSYRGGMPGAAAEAGTQVEMAGTDMLRSAGGRFVEYWVSSDGDHLMEQLGVR